MNNITTSIEDCEFKYNRVKKLSQLKIKYLWNKVFYKLIKYKNKLKKALLIPEVNSILIVRIWSIWDTIRSTSVIENLKKLYKGTSIDILTSKECSIVYENNPNINNIYNLKDLDSLKWYDWIINLQYFPPAKNFIISEINTYETFLSKLNNIPNKLITWNTISNWEIQFDTNILYNETSQEQLYDIALLDWNDESINETKIYLNQKFESNIVKEIKEIKESYKIMWLFLWSYSEWDYDNWFRTYSIKYILNLIEVFNSEYKIVLFWLTNSKTKSEINFLNGELKNYPEVINLTDKTNLEELFHIINEFNILVTSDSWPLHIAMALDIPTVWLFGNAWSFEISPKLDNKNYSIINSFELCNKYNYEWKFFCQECTKSDSELMNCKMHNSKNIVDNIEIFEIKEKIYRLLNKIA